MKPSRTTAFFLFFMFASLSSLCAEGSGVILGQVFELGGKSPISAASVVARNQDDNSTCTGTSGSDGTFFLTSLPSGLYTISAAHPGFQESSIMNYPVRLSRAGIAEPVQIGLAQTGSGQFRSGANRQTYQPVPRANTSESPFEVHIRWGTHVETPATIVPAPQQSADTFALQNSRQISGQAPRQRMPELSTDQILIVAIDGSGEQSDWALIPDPRILRAELPGPSGELSGQTLYRTETDFLVTIPRGLLAAKLNFYHPNWTGREFSLELIGSLSLR
jgi:hypothetical protein